jgi:hypothetical protein
LVVAENAKNGGSLGIGASASTAREFVLAPQPEHSVTSLKCAGESRSIANYQEL